MAKKRFLMSYAYDVPHYSDFTVDARSEAEALKQAEEALAAGVFGDLVGRAFHDNTAGDRVFCSGADDPQDQATFEPSLAELIAKAA